MKRFLIILVGIIAVLFVLAQVFPPTLSELELRDICAGNLGQLGKAIAAYRQNNDGMFPFDPEEHDPACSLLLLYPSYIPLEQMICPTDERRQSVQCENAEVKSVVISYRYCQPLIRDPVSDAILIYDRYPRVHGNTFGHRYGRNVLLVNGSVIWLEEDKFLEARNMGRVPESWWKSSSGERVPRDLETEFGGHP